MTPSSDCPWQTDRTGQAGARAGLASYTTPRDTTDAIVRLVGALMLETNDEWTVARRYMSLETLARVTNTPSRRLPAVAS